MVIAQKQALFAIRNIGNHLIPRGFKSLPFGIVQRTPHHARRIPLPDKADLDHHRIAIKRCNNMIGIECDRRMVGPAHTMQVRKKTARSFITLRDRLAGSRSHAFRPEIFENEKTGIEIAATHLRHTKTLPCQKPVNSGEGQDIFCQMGNLPIGLAVAKRRIIRHLRGIHENFLTMPAVDRLIFTRRGVTLQIAAPSLHAPIFFQKGADRQRTLQPLHGRLRAGDKNVPPCPFMRQHDGKGRLWQKPFALFRPLGQSHALIQKFHQPQFVQFFRRGKPVKIGMGDGKAQRLIALDERECGAWHIKPGIVGNRTDDRTGERGFAGTQIAGKGYEISLLQCKGEILAKAQRGGFVGKKGFENLDRGVHSHRLPYSAAARKLRASDGKRQMTVVPLSSPVSISTRPP
ncbi:Uncharacterised protein [Brucella suis]|nr:Uncharacterised protein [Brucella suis]